MSSEKQYIDLYNQCKGMINKHAPQVLNDLRDKAFDDSVVWASLQRRWRDTNIPTCRRFSSLTMA